MSKHMHMCLACGGVGRYIDLTQLKNVIAKIFREMQETAKEMRESNNALNDSAIDLLKKQVEDAVDNFEKDQ